MRPLHLAAALLALTTSSTAAPSHSHRNRACIDLDLEVSVTANNSIYDVPRVDNNIDAVDWIWDMEAWTAPSVADRIKGVRRVDDTFAISAQLCVPGSSDGSDRGRILQIATHGFGFDKTYWDADFDHGKYSYVDAALKAGYSILTYDRLGVGKSDKPDAYDVVQAPVEVEVLKEITLLARTGGLAELVRRKGRGGGGTTTTPQFEKVVLVGHSLGSAITLGVLAGHGDIVEGAVATGLIPTGELGSIGVRSFGLEHAESHDRARFQGRGSGYLVQATESNLQQIFFKKGDFDKRVLRYGAQIKETGTVGEFLSLGAVASQAAPEYSGPVLFALAEYDFATCAGNCTGAYDLETIKHDLLPGASDVRVHIQPGSGHGLTLHLNATGHYQAIFDYLGGQGL
ncbi:alpha/beta hydrolase [Aspergillus lucknowensis]|uniref:Alpha/beta hydrolase family-domain-containing protein n=1 Tax=Aspergillus lucknowensis TaxID=176173 RepID=A0ABR4LS45_9EURO